MTITRWTPTRGLVPWRLLRELDKSERFFDDFYNRQRFPEIWRRFPVIDKEWTPAIEMYEEEDKFVIKAELPGLKEEDVDISVADNVLIIKGVRKTENEVEEESYHFCERCYGSFFRSIALPAKVDGEKVKAHYEDGMLDINLPKVIEHKPKKVKVTGKKRVTSEKKHETPEK